MEHTIQMQPSYSVLELTLEPEEEVVAEAGAMVWMSDNLELKTSARGGALSGLKRAVLTGESFFQNTFKASGGLGLLGLAPGQPGDIVAHDLADSVSCCWRRGPTSPRPPAWRPTRTSRVSGACSTRAYSC